MIRTDNLKQNTHLNIDTALCGKVTRLTEGYAEVLLHTTRQMAADAQGLVHGGFIFGAADYAAMCVVNEPYVVLGASTSRFIAPIKAGDAVLCKAKVLSQEDRKSIVSVQALVDGESVFEGSFTAFVLDRHVLNWSV